MQGFPMPKRGGWIGLLFCDGTLDRIHHALYVECHEKAKREASPTACIIDSQSVKSAEKGPSIDPHGLDSGKLIKGKKRHILVDMQGLLLHAIVHSAGVQDRDGGIWLLATLFGQFPFLAKLFADSAYAGSIFHTAEHLWQYVDEPLANRCFATIESLDHAVGQRCLALTHQRDTIRDSTLFHWWPPLPPRT